MTKEELIDLLNSDLKHELQHLSFYLHAGAQVQSLFRHEVGEFLMQEASDELEHCKQFATLIAQLGGVPTTEGLPLLASDFTNPQGILYTAKRMEDEVAHRYSERLRQTESHENPHTSYVHVFYEDQIADSWKTARELELMLNKHVTFC